MNWLLFSRVVFWLISSICGGISGWVILDNFRQHKLWLWQLELEREYKQFHESWPFFEGIGS